MNSRRLYRSRDRQLAGVAGGMAEYLDIDPTVVRILWVVVGLASGGLALVGYFVLALVMPQAPYATTPGGWTPSATAPGGWASTPAGTGAAGWATPPAAPGPGWDATAYAGPQFRQPAESRGIGAAAIVGTLLIVIGAIALADVALPGWAVGAILGPAVILTLGAALLASSVRRRPADAPQGPAPAPAMAPAPAGTAPIPALWGTTATQAVSPAVFAPTTGTTPDETTGEGSGPA